MIIGILGGGQLGRMLALAAHNLGLRTRVIDPDPDCPAGRVTELVTGAYDDPDALARFARGLHAATYEFENVPAAATERLLAHVPVRPHPRALAEGQDRLREKALFTRLGIDTPPTRGVSTRDELADAAEALGLPAVLKTRRFGYDGKGQAVLRTPADLDAAWKRLAHAGPFVLEAFVPFRRELSVIGCRALDGRCVAYPLAENLHAHDPHAGGGILRVSRAPAPDTDDALRARAQTWIESLMIDLDYVGVLALELFESPRPDGSPGLIANEMAPRVHNSGHWTIDGAVTSQFENHIRAVAGLPLGDPAPRGCAAMVNIIGRSPPLADLAAVRGAHLHLYDKPERPGRKLGHVNVVAQQWAEVDLAVDRLAAMLNAG